MRKAMIASALLIAGIAGLTGCGNEKEERIRTGTRPDQHGPLGKPGTDFYQFANGGWMKNNPPRHSIRATASSTGSAIRVSTRYAR